MSLHRSWSFPLELDRLGRTDSSDSLNANGISSEPGSPIATPLETDSEAAQWSTPGVRPIDGVSPRIFHQIRSLAWTAYSRLTTLRDLRRRIGISMLSIFRAALLFTLINLIFVALFKNVKSSRRESRLRHDLRGRQERSWIFSHNDEEHREDAFLLGMDLGVGALEVDVWLGESTPRDPMTRFLREDGGSEWDLLVGHRQADTARGRTLTSVYLDPLLERCKTWERDRNPRPRNVSAIIDPDRELYLVVDLKHQGKILFDYLERALQPMLARGYLTTYEPTTSTWYKGFIRVIGTGETPLARVLHQSPRYIFYDAPLLTLAEDHLVPATSYSIEQTVRFTPDISPIASAKLPISYHLGILFPKWRPLNPFIEVLQAYSNEARRNGLEPRWWGYANYPPGIRKKMWKLLANGGSKWICADDLVGATRYLMKREKKRKRLEQLQIERAKTL